jgi:hypothetical protein
MNAPDPATNAKTSGAAAGEVAITSEFLLVGLGSMSAGVLLLVKETTITCGCLQAKVKGDVLGSIGPTEKLASDFEVALKLGVERGTQEITESKSNSKSTSAPASKAPAWKWRKQSSTRRRKRKSVSMCRQSR